MLKDKKIVIGVTGGIAAYKAAELTREFVKNGASVNVIMTRNATEFVTSLTFQTLSGNPVYTDTFSLTGEWEIGHISLAESAQVIVIAPATANVVGKIAGGIADDLLTTTIMATKAPVLICPAMNVNMYENEIVQDNIAKLKARGYRFVDPAYGELACKTEGYGRLAPLADIVEEVETVLSPKDLAKERVLVTAGPTREPFDPVRFITNYSSGKMGYALAVMARRRGAEVVLISGPASLSVPRGVRFISVSSADEMRDAVMGEMKNATIVIKAAAVADYRPESVSADKIKKKAGPLTVKLVRTSDIIAEVGRKKGNRILVGFAAETENLLQHAQKKMMEKGMDMIVANDITKEGAGFHTDTNIVKILDRNGGIEELPLLDKMIVADKILDRVRNLRNRGTGGKKTKQV